MSLSVTEDKTTDAGDVVTHVFTVHNEGTQNDIYSIGVVIPDGWISLPVPGKLLVLAGQTGVVFVNLSVPQGAEAGSYEVTLRATSEGDPSVTAEAVGSVFVRTLWDFSMTWVKQPGRGQPGKWLEGSVRITNSGNAPDEYVVDLEVSPEWETNLLAQFFGLQPGESRAVEFFIRIPETAAAGIPYTVSIRAASIQDPFVTEVLSLSDRLGPPDPHLVRGSTFPPWTVSTDFDIGCAGDPTLSVRGWGQIPGLGYIDAFGTLTMAGIENPRLWLDTGKWSLYLDGGTIAGKFAGFSGSPLVGGRIGQQGMWRILFTEDVRALVGLWVFDCSSLRIAFGEDFTTNLSFEELNIDCDFAGPFAARFFINEATQTESGTAWGIGGELEFDNCGQWEFVADYLDISKGYPGQTPRTEAGVTGSYDGCAGSFDVSFSAVKALAGTPPNEFFIRSKDLDVSVRFNFVDGFAAGFVVGYGKTESDDVPQTTLGNAQSFGLSLQGDLPFPWDLSWASRTTEDQIAGTLTVSQDVAIDGIFPLGAISLLPGIRARLLDDGVTRTVSSSASLSALTTNTEPSMEIGVAVGGSTSSLEVDVTWHLPSGAKVSWVTEVAICGEVEWSTSISAQFPAFFPFCGPSKGRISGYLFLDENENLSRDAGEPGVEGVLLRANGAEAVTGEDGWFVFLPFEPGAYSLQIESLPTGVVAAIPLPITVRVWAGSEPEILIPLQKRSWMRGIVFQDANQNGLRDSSELGIPGVRVLITGAAVSEWVTTDAGGRFVIQLPPGSYSAELDRTSLPERFEATTLDSFAVSVTEDGVVDLSFGAHRRPRPVVVTFGPPTASFTLTPSSPMSGESIRFTAFADSPMGAEIAAYEWEFTQGQARLTRSGQETIIALPTSGTWHVRLVVTDTNGLRGASERDILLR